MAYQQQVRRQTATSLADFSQLAQTILYQRFLRAVVYEAFFAYVIGVVANINLQRGLFSIPIALFSLRTFGYTLAVYATGLAVLLIHSQLYQVTRAPHGSHFPKLQRLLRDPLSTGMTMGAYIGFSYFMLIVHGWMFGTQATSMWLYLEGNYGPPQLNPGWVASWVLATAIGAGYGAQLIMNERLQLSFPSVEQSRVYTFKDRLPGCLVRSFDFAFSALWRFWLGYFVFGWGLYRSICGFIGHIITTSSYRVGNPLLGIGNLMFWLLNGTLVVLCWEFAHSLFEIVVTEPTHINELSPDHNGCLVNGLRHKQDKMVQYLAYQELYRITEFSSKKRAGILTDIDRSAGSMWSQVLGECLDVIKTATDQIKTQNPAAKSSPTPAKSEDEKLNKNDTGSTIMQAGGAPMKDILQRSSKRVTWADGQGNDSRLASNPAANPITRQTVPLKDLFGPEAQGLEKYVLTTIRDALVQSTVGQRILLQTGKAQSTIALANFQQQVWAVRSLMRLAKCSLKEDAYGVVQKDIPTVLTVLFAYLKELESSVSSSQSGSGYQEFNVQHTSRQTLSMIQVVRNEIYGFTIAFYEYLEELKLPREVSQKLQAFADFQA